MRESQLAARIAVTLLASCCVNVDDGTYVSPAPSEIQRATCDAYDILHAARLEGARRYKNEKAARLDANCVTRPDGECAISVRCMHDEASVNDR